MRKRFLSIILVAVLIVMLLPQETHAVPVLDNQKQDLAEKVARQIVAGMPSWVDTDEEKVMYLYDYIIETTTYEFNDDDQTAYGSLVKGKCVCAGYAKGLALLMNTAGIEAGTEIGWNAKTGVLHEWTYLHLGGIKLYADATWGDLDREWDHIDWHPEKQIHYYMTMTEKQQRQTHAEYLFADGVYDGSGDDAGGEYSYAGILERSGVPVGHFNRETKPEDVLPYFQVIYHDGTNALIRAVYYYEEAENDYYHSFAANRAAEMYLDSVTESHVVVGPECEVYYWGPLADYNITPAQAVVLRTGEERSARKGEILIVTAEVLPYEASNKRVIYSSSDPSVAAVDKFGKVTGISEGTAVITATSVDGGHTDSMEITIVSDHYHDSWLKNILMKEPTCEEPGHKMYFLCQSCGAWFPDYWASAEIENHESWMIPALGHEESAWLHDEGGHWKQCNRSGCGKLLQEKTNHSDGNSDGICDICGFRSAEPTPTQPTVAPTEPTATSEAPTVPAGPTVTTQPTTIPAESTTAVQPSTTPAEPAKPAATTPGTETTPTTVPDEEEPGSRGNSTWLPWAALGFAALIPVLILLLRRKTKE